MPTYSYLCEDVGGPSRFEQRISEDPVKKCSLCGKPKPSRRIVSGNFILKGGGWYSDGYGSSSKSSARRLRQFKLERLVLDVQPDHEHDTSSCPAPARRRRLRPKPQCR